MAFTEDEEILQDYLVEAGEILEKLNEQLVELENSPDDNELLNAVFRGFHTIKGGASFLSLSTVVEVCHRSEDVFNLLRNGERHVDAQLMDVILPVLDSLNGQFDALNNSAEPEPAAPELLIKLDQIISGDGETNVEVEPVKAESVKEVSGSTDGDMTDDEFEALLDNLDGNNKPDKATDVTAKVAANSNDELTEDEFENLLDKINGTGAPTGKPAKVEIASKEAVVGKDAEVISDDEFEALLDTLQTTSGKNVKTNTDSAVETKEVKVASNKETPALKEVPKAAPKKETKKAETTVRVDTSRLDDIMNLVGELVLVRNRMTTIGATINDDELEKVVANFDLVTTDLQAAVMKTRMQPIKKVFGRFPRVIRDLARSLKKKINLELQGEETDLDKNLVDALADPLVHLVRNAVDHGIEMPDVRLAAGKSEEGTVILGAKQEGDHISLTIEDDGAGMDPDKLRGIAVSKGLMDQSAADRLTDTEAFNLIFMAGFSTKVEITDVSGRGVGMDVVKNSIAQLNGSVEIESQIGKGSKLTIKVPLTLAIMPTLMVKLEAQVFALPLANVGEILNLDLTKTNVVDGQLVVMNRGRALPIYYLRRWLIRGATADQLPEFGHVVVVSIGAQRVGFVVDQLVGQEEVVIKPLGSSLQGTPGLSGATITGDGNIALILDVPELMKSYARSIAC